MIHFLDILQKTEVYFKLKITRMKKEYIRLYQAVGLIWKKNKIRLKMMTSKANSKDNLLNLLIKINKFPKKNNKNKKLQYWVKKSRKILKIK